MQAASKIASITGGAGGIGQATVLRLLENGFFPVILDRDVVAGENFSATINDQGRKAEFIPVELSKPAEVRAAFDRIISRYGDVEVLVNLAGGTLYRKLLEDLSVSEWHEVIDANLTSTFLCCQAVIPLMKKKNRGKIVNTSSNFGSTGSTLHTAYSAAKSAMVGLTKSLALELAPHGITVNCIAPGFTATPRVLSHNSPKAMADRITGIPAGRAGEAIDIANAIAFLVSEESDYITGQTLHVNGGLVMP